MPLPENLRPSAFTAAIPNPDQPVCQEMQKALIVEPTNVRDLVAYLFDEDTGLWSDQAAQDMCDKLTAIGCAGGGGGSSTTSTQSTASTSPPLDAWFLSANASKNEFGDMFLFGPAQGAATTRKDNFGPAFSAFDLAIGESNGGFIYAIQGLKFGQVTKTGVNIGTFTQ